ncbi:MAG TPA: hypothetical protein VEL79_02250 [Vicinamibacterales bacterium]|nr:hypothetical protein [Vicinamibacterales bacterium]
MIKASGWSLILAPAFLISLVADRAASAIAPVTLMRLPPGGIQPQVAIDGKGAVHVLYFKGDAAHGDLFYARLLREGMLSKAIQVNAHAGSVEATGTMRGGHLAIGKNGRVHVAWHGSSQALPKAVGDATPVLYTRMNAAGTAFEPERDVVQRRLAGLDGGTVAADPAGNVYVAWHAFEPGLRGEADRRVWITRSSDDGQTFAEEIAASNASTGACGCCAVAAMADHRGTLYALYRAATESVHRDTYLLTSRDRGLTFADDKLQDWNIGACPMSSFSLTDASVGILAAWETAGQVQWTRIDPLTGERSGTFAAPSATKNRKHPFLAANNHGQVILAWTEGTGWNKGGGIAWQVFDQNGHPIGEPGRAPGVPAWSCAAAAPTRNGEFVILY